MPLRFALPFMLVVAVGSLPAATVSFVLYAVDARAADLFPPEVASNGAKLAEYLQGLKEEGKVETRLEFAGEVSFATTTEFADRQEVEVPKSFTAEDNTLTREQSETRMLGHKASARAFRSTDGLVRLQVNFEWTPTFDRIPIPEGGEDAWMPRFHTLKAEVNYPAAQDERFVAAVWRSGFPLAPNERPLPRQLYLVMHWTEDPAE